MENVYLITGIVIGIVILGVIIWKILQSPFEYPYFSVNFDVSGKRRPKIEDLIDLFLIDKGFNDIDLHIKEVYAWKLQTEKQINKSLLKKYRRKQYEKVVDDEHEFIFGLVRYQTRYKQKDYVKTSYKVPITELKIGLSYRELKNRYQQLENINFETTLSAYNNASQRKLMTAELRKQIMNRDNYTCQICGKYMPDEVGLQIDHIKPVAKGGKTVPSNLQVLCSKCNGSKRDRY